jgi:superfamily I DNA/RNA helicase
VLPAVEGAGLRSVKIDDRSSGVSGAVAVGTMHMAKGLEYRAVAVAACDDEILPLQKRIEGIADTSDLEEVYVDAVGGQTS